MPLNQRRVLSLFQRFMPISAFYPHFSFRFQFQFPPFSFSVLSRPCDRASDDNLRKPPEVQNFLEKPGLVYHRMFLTRNDLPQFPCLAGPPLGHVFGRIVPLEGEHILVLVAFGDEFCCRCTRTDFRSLC